MAALPDAVLLAPNITYRLCLSETTTVETELLKHLDRNGLTAGADPTTDGRLFANGVVVMTYVEGGPPETETDSHRVGDTRRPLHRLTQGWPQRPGWRSSTRLLHTETGTRINFGAIPPDGVA